MLPRSRLDEMVRRVTFDRKTQWFQHNLPLSPESAPDDSRGVPDASRGAKPSAPGASSASPKVSSRIPLLTFLLQDSSSGIPS